LAEDPSGTEIRRTAPLPALPDPGTSALGHHGRAVDIASRMVLAAAVLFIAAAVALFGFRYTYDDAIYPGVSVAGIELGGMTRAEAREALEAKAREIEGQRAYFDALGRHWAPTLSELGVHVDIEGSLDQAFAIGREEEGRARVTSVLESLRTTTSLPIRVDISPSELESWSAKVGEELAIVPHDAELIIEDGSVSTVPESKGTVVDVKTLQSMLIEHVARLDTPTAPLPLIDEQPNVFASDLEPARRQIEAALSTSVTLDYSGTTWKINPKDFGNYIQVLIDEESSGPESVLVDVDHSALARWLSETIGPSINEDPVNAKVAFDGKKLIATKAGIDGVRMLPSSLAESVTQSFFDEHQRVDVPVQILKPEVNGDNLDTLGITTKLAAGSSNFDGSDDARSTNIQVGINLLNGTLIAPGGEYSFNRSIGVISHDLGFVDAQVIDGERIGRDVGGGICQVSTTVFRAALYAGVPITEWHPHRYRLGFYELDGWKPGLDASILQPEGDPFGGGDFKFVNPTDSWMLIEAYVEWPRAYVVIYGPDLNYTVEVSDPVFGQEYQPTADLEIVDTELPAGSVVQTEWALKGMEVTYYRTVYSSDGEGLLSDSYYVYFAPRGNVYKVSPEMQGFSPAG
jgi:vancomycin resistance protein YoaR